MQQLREKQLFGKFKKSEFSLPNITFLGHVISKDGLFVEPQKIETIVNWSRSTNIAEVCTFLGSVGYYRRFVKDFKIAMPLTKLTQKDVPHPFLQFHPILEDLLHTMMLHTWI